MIRFVKKQKSAGGYRRVLMASAVYTASAFVHGAAVAQDSEVKVYSIPPSDVGAALQAYSEQADVEIIYAEQAVEGKSTGGVSGSYSREAALEELIDDAGLTYEINKDGVVVIQSSMSVKKQVLRSPAIRVAQTTAVRSSEMNAIDRSAAEVSSDDAEGENRRDVVVVVGTNIRGIAPESSPVRTFTRDDIDISGAATAQDFIQTLPQNFGGGSNADIRGLPNDPNTFSNQANGSSVNLRGLGSGATLVLLNGRRVAPASAIGDFVDISMIPTSAIDRVEVLTDGASSIYGADAVAGVVNFVLRDDFDGVEASYRYGTVTEGGRNEHRASASAGKDWATGNALVVYEHLFQDRLSAESRTFSEGAPLPTSLIPRQERDSVLISLSQQVSSGFDVYADGFYSKRDSISITSDAFGTDEGTTTTEQLNIAAGGTWNFSNDWFFDVSTVYGKTKTDLSFLNTRFDLTSVSEYDSSVLTIDTLVSGTVFNILGGEVKLAMGGQYRNEDFVNNFLEPTPRVDAELERDVYAAFGEVYIPIISPNNAISGVRRLELNISGRFEDFSDFGSTANPKVGILYSPTEGLRFRGTYSTSFNPPVLGIVGQTNRTGSVIPVDLIGSAFGVDIPASIAGGTILSVRGAPNGLEAETSRAFTLGFDFEKEWGEHSIKMSSTYFDIDFENRLGATPIPNGQRSLFAPIIATETPELLPADTVVFDFTPDEITEILNGLTNVFGVGNPDDVNIVNFADITRNLARSVVAGFDFDVTYGFNSEVGTIILGIDGSYLSDFQQQSATTTPLIDLENTQFNPVALRMRGRAGYSHNGFVASIFLNYTDSYRVDNTDTSEPIDSWATVDLTFSYDTQDRFSNTLLDNTTLRISVLNLFDQNPPSTPGNPAFRIFGYDPANASALNRFVAFEITKRF